MATKKTTPVAEEAKAKKAPAKPAAAKTTSKTIITESDIRKKAEEIYNQRMVTGEPGDPMSDWLNAEKALNAAKKK